MREKYEDTKAQRGLNLNDIQGNVLRAYGRHSFPFARYFFFNINPEVYDSIEIRLDTIEKLNKILVGEVALITEVNKDTIVSRRKRTIYQQNKSK